MNPLHTPVNRTLLETHGISSADAVAAGIEIFSRQRSRSSERWALIGKLLEMEGYRIQETAGVRLIVTISAAP